MFKIGQDYTKNDIYEILDVPTVQRHGAWDTGYREYLGNFYIFANIGVAGRTGHNYKNFWDGDSLHWEAKDNSHLGHASIKKMIELNSGTNIFIFSRTNNKDPFTYEGIGKVLEYFDSRPVKIIWGFAGLENDLSREEILPEEVSHHFEGTTKKILVNKYERNPQARRACIKHYGFQCQVCNFDFGEFYGALGEAFIQVHHLVPISSIKETYQLNPISDLIPVCANCHSMIHRKRVPLSISELKGMIKVLK